MIYINTCLKGPQSRELIRSTVASRDPVFLFQVGLITSGLIYIDFSESLPEPESGSVAGAGARAGEPSFVEKVDELVRALGDRGKIH